MLAQEKPIRTVAQEKKIGLAHPILRAFILSLLFHVLFLLAFPFVHRGDLVPNETLSKPMRVIWQKPKPKFSPQDQLVDVLDTENLTSETPDTKYLSDQNRRVERQTQARETGLPSNARSQNQPNVNERIANENDSREGPSNEQTLSKERRPFDFSLPQSFIDQEIPRKDQASLPPTNYLPDISIGNETVLSTKEFAYQSFFIRMKRQMEGNWNVRSLMSGYRETQSEYVAVVSIVLNDKGYVDRVELVQSSGLGFYDREAIETVHRSAPYLNPPSALLGPDKKIRIPKWGFIYSIRTLF